VFCAILLILFQFNAKKALFSSKSLQNRALTQQINGFCQPISRMRTLTEKTMTRVNTHIY
jgi:hypothetical protein